MSDKYRFTLQWGGETAEKVQAGELLKNLGSRKSGFIVAAISEYIKFHPEMLTPGLKSTAAIEPGLTRVQIEALVKGMIDARLASVPPPSYVTDNSKTTDFIIDDDMEAMFKNLECFEQ